MAADVAAQGNSGARQASHQPVILRHHAVYAVQPGFGPVHAPLRLSETRVRLGEVCFNAGLVRFEARLLLEYEFLLMSNSHSNCDALRVALPGESQSYHDDVCCKGLELRRNQSSLPSGDAALRHQITVHPFQYQPAHLRQFYVSAIE